MYMCIHILYYSILYIIIYIMQISMSTFFQTHDSQSCTTALHWQDQVAASKSKIFHMKNHTSFTETHNKKNDLSFILQRKTACLCTSY